MTERIAHAAAADQLMRKLALHPAPDDRYDVEWGFREAQVHATLALVEQQRIANLIALATGVDVIGGTGIARQASDEAHRQLVSDPNGQLRPSIREALGL